jgi:hypothetical protein
VTNVVPRIVRPLILCVLAGCLLAAAVSARESAVAFDVHVKYGIMGGAATRRLYHLTPGELVILQPTPDNEDDPEVTEEVARVEIDAETSRELQRFMAKFPLKRLRKRYDDPSVHDGIRLDFDISRGGEPAKRILMLNKSQPDLRRLCGRINGLIEEKELRVGFPNTKRPPLPEDG